MVGWNANGANADALWAMLNQQPGGWDVVMVQELAKGPERSDLHGHALIRAEMSTRGNAILLHS
eukprot:12675166-Prorocentrum_lima.AAC.1